MSIRALIAFFIFFMIINFDCPTMGSSSQILLNEIIASTNTPHAYDWPGARSALELTHISVNERNSFESSGYSLAFRSKISNHLLGWIGFRELETRATESSLMISKMPYTQAAQPSRQELFVGVGVPLLAGRSFTILSPYVPNLEHALYLKGGFHYSLYNRTSSEVNPLPGQRILIYREVLETGVRVQWSAPFAISLIADFDYFIPLTPADRDLRDWTHWAGGLSWSY